MTIVRCPRCDLMSIVLMPGARCPNCGKYLVKAVQ